MSGYRHPSTRRTNPHPHPTHADSPSPPHTSLARRQPMPRLPMFALPTLRSDHPPLPKPRQSSFGPFRLPLPSQGSSRPIAADYPTQQPPSPARPPIPSHPHPSQHLPTSRHLPACAHAHVTPSRLPIPTPAKTSRQPKTKSVGPAAMSQPLGA